MRKQMKLNLSKKGYGKGLRDIFTLCLETWYAAIDQTKFMRFRHVLEISDKLL